MIIQTQNKEEIINFDNVMNIEITNCDEDGFGIFAGFIVGRDDNYRLLGYYKSKERAREVLQEIISKYRKWNKDANDAVTIIPKVYEMPKE